MASRFADFVQDPPIEVFELTRQFNEDTFYFFYFLINFNKYVWNIYQYS